MDGSSQSRLTGALVQWRGIAGRPAVTPAELTQNMQALYAAIYGTEFEKLDPAEARSIAQPASVELFDLYLTLRDRVPEWRAQGLMREGAPLAVRNAMRVLRYTIDIIGEVANGFELLGAGQSTHRAFEGPAHFTLLHPALREGQGVDFRAGDLLLVRGQVHNSAAIARIGDVDSQFSHIGIIHIDDDGRRWVIQALIEEGSVWTPLDEVLDHGLVRAVLFRHRDGGLAKRAAALVAAYVEKSNRGPFGWMPYDFSMEPAGDDRFFCSKLVAYAYREASGGALALPSFPTRLAMSNRDFFDRLGVTAVETIAPADFEVEPAFDLVAEWRDYRVTSQIRMQDLLMSKLFDWMDAYGYEFRESLGMGVLALVGRLTSWGPDVVKRGLVVLGFPKIPSNMSARTIATIGMLHDTAQPILERLVDLERERIKTTGRPLHPGEVQAELERFRANAAGRIGYLVAP